MSLKFEKVHMASDAMYAIQWDGSYESVDFIKQCLHQHRIGVFYINISDFHQTMTKAEREGKVYFHPYIALAKGDAYVRMERTDWVIYGQSGVVKVYPDSAKCSQFMTNENLLPEPENEQPEEPTQPEEDMNPEDYNPEDPINDDEGLDHNDIQDPEGDYTGEENTDIDIDVEVTPGTPEGDNDVVVWPKDPDILTDEDVKDVTWDDDADDAEVTDETPDDDQA